MINIILFILLIIIAILLIIQISFYKYNSKLLNNYYGGGNGACTICGCDEYQNNYEDDLCYNCEHPFSKHIVNGTEQEQEQSSTTHIITEDEQIHNEWDNLLNDELLISDDTTLSTQMLAYINSFSPNKILIFFDTIFKKYKKNNANRLTKIFSLFFTNTNFSRKLLSLNEDIKNMALNKIEDILIQIYTMDINLDLIISILSFMCKYYSSEYINIIKNKLTTPQLGDLNTFFKKEYIINANNQYGTIYKLYDVIEINFNNSEDLILKQSIHTKIIEYIQTLISEDAKKHSPSIEFLLYGDNRDDRDKLLNNLALLVIGINSTEYVCILLYPVLFKAFREFKENVEKINFGSSPVYAQPNENGILDNSEGSNKFISRKGIFMGGGYGRCTECTGCEEYQDSGQDDGLCYNCEHPFTSHEENIENIDDHEMPTEVPIIAPAIPSSTNTGKDKFKKALKMANSDYKQARFIEESKFKEFIIQILNSKLNHNIPFFYIPTKVKFTKEWRPMLIKPLKRTNTDFMDIYYRGQARTFLIDCHGAYSYGLNNTLKTIDLYDNEIVVMSCATLECTARFPQNMAMFCCNSRYYKNMFLEQLLSDYEKLRQPFLKKYEAIHDIRNNYCVYTKRCPNLALQFYNHEPNTLYKELPRPVYEFPTQFRSRTIGDLIATLPDPSILGSIDQNIKDLLISNAPYDNISGIAQFLENTIENTRFLSSIYYNNMILYSLNNMNDASLDPAIISWLSTHKIRMNCLLDKFDKDLGQPKEQREIQTYYTHINPKKQETGTLFDEITKIREYYTKIDPKQQIIYFVSSCRA